MKEHEDTIRRWDEQGFILTSKQRDKLLALARLKNRSHGFEVICSHEYKNRNPGTEIYYIDIGGDEIYDGLREAFGRSQEPTQEARQKILAGLTSSIEEHLADLRGLVDFQYSHAHKLASFGDAINANFENELGHLSPKAKESLRHVLNPKRNESMAAAIKKYHNNNGISVAVMGATHIYMIGYLLSYLRPAYILLNEVPVPNCK